VAALPASFHVGLSQLKAAAGAQSAGLASEEEFRERFPDCETGAMPPFGNLYDMPVFADESLAEVGKTEDSQVCPRQNSFHRSLAQRVARRS
jgi:prolyl-tRNA editing enzyme YbaK/EbsC (Cys-tRNA(Pro) deacylase)